MKKSSLSAMLAAGLLAGGLTASGAFAADLGGNCCADLEERIAELEATTARKGNRKVSLTITGWVAEQITWWDDGHESNIYIGGLGTTLASHVTFQGQAQITPGWTAGYVLQLEANTNEPFTYNQDNPNTRLYATGGITPLQSYWFVKSDSYGKISVGRQSQASDNAAILPDGSGSLVPANWVVFDGSNFFLRDKHSGPHLGATWGGAGFYCHGNSLGIGADCNGVPLNNVRYDSPTFAGFSVSASWGEDDFWDVAGRYASEMHGFKIAAAAAYDHQSDECGTLSILVGGNGASTCNLGNQHNGGIDSGYFQIGAYVQHVATGLFVYGAYGHEFNDTRTTVLAGSLTTRNTVGDDDHWYLKAGIRQKWNHLGNTVGYVEYGQHSDMFNQDGTNFKDTAGCAAFGISADTACEQLNSDATRWGLGVVQEIDAAAMSMWLKYRHHDLDADFVVRNAGADSIVHKSYQEIHFVGFGALINF